MMPSRTPGFDNPDYVHLKSLSDLLKNIVLWAQAADAQCQILLAKRAPVLNLPRPPAPLIEAAPAPSDPAPVVEEEAVAARVVEPLVATAPKEDPFSKGVLWRKATSLGIPESVLEKPDYLGTKGRPSLTGMIKTKKLIDDAMEKIVVGEDPSVLWVAPEAEIQTETLFDFSSEPV